MDIQVGDNVKAVRGPAKTVSCEPNNIGQVGTVLSVSEFLGGLWVTLEFPWGVDECDVCNLERV